MTSFQRPFIRPIRFAPVFVGHSEDGEKVVLYNRVGREGELHIKCGNGELMALSPGTEVSHTFDLDDAHFYIAIDSPQWSGTARGTRKELIEEEGIR